MNPDSGYALITGGSSGIGFQLARQFARRGYGLVLVASHPETLTAASARLNAEFDVPVRAVAQDLSRPGAVSGLLGTLVDESLDITVLVNDAGVGCYGRFIELDGDEELAMLQLNIIALTELTRAFLGPMVARGCGMILNVASTAAFQPGPLMAAYYASKAYVLSLTEALAEETRGTGVTVGVLCPGPTASGFQHRAGMDDSRLFDWGVMAAETVAEIGFRGIMTGQGLIVPGVRNRLLAALSRVAPRRLVCKAVRMLQDRRLGPRRAA
jgi:short-subunit dehydrogenase